MPIRQNTKFHLDLNPNPSECSSLVTFWSCYDKEVYFLQQGLVRLVEMSEIGGKK